MTTNNPTPEKASRKPLFAGIALGLVANALAAGVSLCYAAVQYSGMLSSPDSSAGGLLRTLQASAVAACLICPLVVNVAGLGFCAVTKRRQMLLGWLIGAGVLIVLVACLGVIPAALLLAPPKLYQ